MGVLRADLHMHTHHSKDSLSSVEAVLAAAEKRHLGAIAITDHNEIAGAFAARDAAMAQGLGLQVIIGEEVSTDKGDLLVYFLKKRIAPGPLAEALAEAKSQGAVCSAAHPYDFVRHGINLEKLPAPSISAIGAIEAFNARVTAPWHNTAAERFALLHKKALLAGSDAHHPSEIGAAYAQFEGIRRLDARNILSAKREIRGTLSPKYAHLFSRYAVLRKKLGWKIPER